MTGLGIDAGGTQTRWALARADGSIVADGAVGGLTALQMATVAGRAHMHEVLRGLAGALPHAPAHVCAGLTGFTTGGDALRDLMADALGVPAGAVTLRTDIEIACHDLFGPGEGYVVYAGTGTIAAFIDADGAFHRAGGRGAILDDAGGGFWIAIEALRNIWRAEDLAPGSWTQSPLAVEMFQRIGGDDWVASKEFIYTRERGDIGKLALAVAAAAPRDAVARDILTRAGKEIARLATAMLTRFGPRPIALAGRVVNLHPLIEQSLRASLPPGTALAVRTSEAHLAAARIAARHP